MVTVSLADVGRFYGCNQDRGGVQESAVLCCIYYIGLKDRDL